MPGCGPCEGVFFWALIFAWASLATVFWPFTALYSAKFLRGCQQNEVALTRPRRSRRWLGDAYLSMQMIYSQRTPSIAILSVVDRWTTHDPVTPAARHGAELRFCYRDICISELQPKPPQALRPQSPEVRGRCPRPNSFDGTTSQDHIQALPKGGVASGVAQ